MAFRFLRLATLLPAAAALGLPLAQAATPEQTVAAFAAAVKSDGISAAARFTHPEEQASVRAALEPVVTAGLRKRSTRELYSDFADPYNLASMMKLDDEQFLRVFMKWVEKQQPQKFEFRKVAQYIPLGHVEEGDVQHVVTRLVGEIGDPKRKIEEVVVFSTRDDNGTPKLLLLPDFKEIVYLLTRTR